MYFYFIVNFMLVIIIITLISFCIFSIFVQNNNTVIKLKRKYKTVRYLDQVTALRTQAV